MLTGSVTSLIVIFWGVWILRGDRIRQESPARVLLTLAFVFYLSRVIAATHFPLPISGDVIAQERILSAAGLGAGNNFVPFETISAASMSEFTFVRQVIGNFLLLTPLGFLAPLLWERFKGFGCAFALVFGATLAIEFTQLGISGILGFSYRSFDVDDIWLNTLGGLFGFFLMRLTVKAVSSLWHQEAPAVTDSGLRETVPYQSGL